MRTTFKQLRFPTLGVAAHLSYGEATMPDENRAYATPAAKNVRGQCTFGDRSRGGSRPGLMRLEGTVTVANGGKWLWPNGEAIKWPDGANIAYSTVTQEIIAPDGSSIIDPHEPFSVSCAKGAVPPAPSLMAMYRERLFLADGASWFCSRVGELGDFDYGGDGDDPARASSGNCALSGRKGEAITAFMPVDDGTMFVSTKRSMWAFSGEPTAGIHRISEFTGCVSANAWCRTPQGVVFLAPDGVYGVSAEQGVRLLSGRLPEAFSGLSSALLGYDPERNGVYIFSRRDSDACDWFFDLGAGAFWPMEIPNDMRPTAICRIVYDGVDKAVLHGVDGVWRMFHTEQSTDDGEEIESSVAIGPFRISARDDLDGILDELRVTLGEGSGAVTIGVATAKTAEGAVKAAASAQAQYAGGYNFTQRARRRGAWGCITLSSTARWAYESILATLKLTGRLR